MRELGRMLLADNEFDTATGMENNWLTLACICCIVNNNFASLYSQIHFYPCEIV